MRLISRTITRRGALRAAASTAALAAAASASASVAGCLAPAGTAPTPTGSRASIAASILSSLRSLTGELESALDATGPRGASLAGDVLNDAESFATALESGTPIAAQIVSGATEAVSTIKTLLASHATVSEVAGSALTALGSLSTSSTTGQVATAFSFFAELALDVAQLAVGLGATTTAGDTPAAVIARTRGQVLLLRAQA